MPAGVGKARVLLFTSGGLLLYQRLTTFFLAVFPSSFPALKFGWVLSALLAVRAILISVLGSQTMQRTLNWRPVVSWRSVSISYSVYLLQFIIILCCCCRRWWRCSSMQWDHPTLFCFRRRCW